MTYAAMAGLYARDMERATRIERFVKARDGVLKEDAVGLIGYVRLGED